MSGAKEIRSKIKSIKSTQKITRAMEMVAASKMRKAQDQMMASRPYAERIREVIDHLAKGSSEYQHQYLISRPEKRIGLIVVTSDRGLCGGLNANLFRSLINQIKLWKEAGVSLKFAAIGSKAQNFFKQMGGELMASKTGVGDNPNVEDVIGPVSIMLNAFEANELDAVYLAHNKFLNTMTQRPDISRMIPIAENASQAPSPADLSKQSKYGANGSQIWDYIYEPNAKSILDLLLKRFIESQVYQGAVENFACEQAARMIAMKSASDNAGEIIEDLQLAFNKARQAAITREISEIVSGAAAV